MNYDYDLFVIGAGSAGVRASRVAAQLGAKVAIAEDLYLGGTCVNVGCVPKKLFVYASKFSTEFRSAKGFGWKLENSTFNWHLLRENKNAEINRLNGVYANILNGANVKTIYGRATILGPHTIRISDKNYSAERIIIATGGWPTKPDYPGGESTISSNDVFHLETFPKTVLVQGGGYIAVEFAGIFNGLGVETELVYRRSVFLRGFDQDIRNFVAEQVAASGVQLTFNTDIEKIEKTTDGKLEVTLTDGSTRTVDAVFSAIGRKPKTEALGLENTKAELDTNGAILVDKNFQTKEPSIYAIGDVVGRKALTPVALEEGMALAKHLYGGEEITLDYRNIATAVFCQPNIATVGLSEDEAAAEGYKFDVYKSSFTPMKNTLDGLPEKSLMKLLVDKDSDKVIGAHMVGPEAGEIIQGIAIAINAGATKADFDKTVGIHPTAAEEFVSLRTPVIS